MPRCSTARRLTNCVLPRSCLKPRRATARNSFSINSQAAGAFDDVADDVFVDVIDFSWIGFLARAEDDQAAGEVLPGEAVRVADLIVEVFEALQSRADLDNCH